MADIEQIRKKIDRLILDKGLNYRDVSLKIGRKDSYIQQYVKYGYPRRLKEIDRMRLAKILDINDTEIMDDEVIASKTLGTSSNDLGYITDIIEASRTPEGDLVKTDFINPAADNSSDPKNSPAVTGRQFLSRHLFQQITDCDSKNVKLTKITDDSMKPSINIGDIIWFDASCTCPESDGLYLLATGREITVKRLQISPLDGSVEISCDNPVYKTYTAASSEGIKILGKLIAHLHKI